MKNYGLTVWIEGAIMAALAYALQYIPNVGLFDIAIGVIPITLYSFRRGLVPGLYAGLVMGLLHFVFGNIYYLKVSQVMIEYILAFVAIGLAGVVAKQVRESAATKSNFGVNWIILGSFIGIGVKYFFHFIAGVIFWGSYAPKGMGPWVYSLMVNGTSGIINFVICTVVLVAVYKLAPALFIPQQTKSLTSARS